MQRERRRVLLVLAFNDARIHRGVLRYAREAQWVVRGGLAVFGRVDGAWHGNGVIANHLGRADVLSYLESVDAPVVSLDWRREQFEAPTVNTDNVAIGRMAGEYFVSRGFRHIAMVNFGRQPNLPAQRNAAGLKEVVEAAGRRFYKFHAAKIVEQLRDFNEPVAALCPNDFMARDLMDKLLDAGVRIPEDIALMGVDENEFCGELCAVPLSSVDNNMMLLGYRAAQLLDQLMDGEAVPNETIYLPPRQVVVRQSTDIVAVPHEKTSQALRYIHAHYRDIVIPEDLALRVGMCRRQLEESFKRYIGHTISKEVERLRLAHARRLLVATTYTHAEIAEDAGFNSLVQMDRAFRRVLSCTPRAYRNRMSMR